MFPFQHVVFVSLSSFILGHRYAFGDPHACSSESSSCGNEVGLSDEKDGEDVALLQTNFRPDRDHPDKDVLRWTSKDEHGRKIGKLRVQLDPFDENSPFLHLRVVMRPSRYHPASLGPLLMHCGGRKSANECVSTFEHKGEFDIWSIDQRGVGEHAEPPLLCESATLPPEGRSSYSISDFTTCNCALPEDMPEIGKSWANIQTGMQSEVLNLFNKASRWGSRCVESPKFRLMGLDGKVSYNFLDYVGTNYLAYDIDQFRKAIGARSMSIHGLGYGAYVASTYATIFPKETFRIVMDGNVMAMPQKQLLAEGMAEGLEQAIAYLLRNCGEQPIACRLKDPARSFDKIMDDARNRKLTAKTKTGKRFVLTEGMIAAYLQVTLSDKTGNGWADALDLLSALADNRHGCNEKCADAVAFILDGFCCVAGTPTWYVYDVCVGAGSTSAHETRAPSHSPNNCGKFGEPFIEQAAILGADLAGAYTVVDAMQLWDKAQIKWSPWGLTTYSGVAAGTFFWPVPGTPVPPLGNPTIKALVIGNLYDPLTSYSWSQTMSAAFPAASLMTWQGAGHTLPDTPTASKWNYESIDKCNENIVQYMNLGKLPMNGYLCRQKHPPPVTAIQEQDGKNN